MSVNHPFFYKGLYITLISALCFYFPTQGLAEPVSTLPDLAEPPPLWHTPSPETEFDKQLKAAAQGDAAAQYNLGVMYDNGEGVAEDDIKAVAWYQKAADQGYAGAQTNLGWMYVKGKGVTKDAVKAVAWYQKAAAQGDADAQLNLGWMYEKGKGVTKDTVKAVAWYQKAAAQGDTDALQRLKVLKKRK